MGKTIFITGGARSGKSRFAQELAQNTGLPVLFVATAAAGDRDMQQRIAKHQQARPAGWRTLEATHHIGSRIEPAAGNAQVVIIDCITLLVSNIFGLHNDDDMEKIEESMLEEQVTAEIRELINCIQRLDITFILVTNEVGLGLVPDNRMGRLYRDLLGKANQLLAQHAGEVYLMVSGLPVRVKPLD